MSSDEIAISVQGLAKCYHIYDKPRDRLLQMLARGRRQYYREFWALRNTSFDIKKGETIGIVGLNGSGKSTLLKLICGTLSPTEGTVQTHGRIAALLELGTGFNPEFTGRENIYLNGSIYGLSEEEIGAKFDAIIKFADIGDFIDQPVKRYSSGMYVRLAFAVIANVDADILVIDEALAVGDALFSQKCMRFLRDFKEKGTVFFVSHNTGAVVNLCDRAVWLERGQVQAIGSAKEVCQHYLARRYNSKITDQRNDQKSGSVASVSPTLRGDQLAHARDMRMDFINHSNLRNDIQIFEFSSVKSGFGNGGATLLHAGLEDKEGRALSWVVGGETVSVVVKASVTVECANVVIGFNLKDRLGQVLIGQNTYVDTSLVPVKAKPGDLVQAIFTFRFPILPKGTYVIDVAIADGHPPDVVQLQWVHEAFVLESHATSATGGLIGMIFDRIELQSTRKEVADE
jgi:lipopolysaccharide transport system ATP-binding protein